MEKTPKEILGEIVEKPKIAEIIDISNLIYNPHWCTIEKRNCSLADYNGKSLTCNAPCDDEAGKWLGCPIKK